MERNMMEMSITMERNRQKWKQRKYPTGKYYNREEYNGEKLWWRGIYGEK